MGLVFGGLIWRDKSGCAGKSSILLFSYLLLWALFGYEAVCMRVFGGVGDEFSGKISGFCSGSLSREGVVAERDGKREMKR